MIISTAEAECHVLYLAVLIQNAIINSLQHSEFAPQHELVAATGSGQSGALVVFQRNIRPNVVRSTDALAGATCLWTVFCRKEIVFEGVSQFESRSAAGTEEGVEEVYDKLLVISKDNFTLVS